jgi:AcrR family transcriptional regulator
MAEKTARVRQPVLPKQTRSHETHERILKSAEDLLSVYDFNGVTVEDIAEKACVSVGTFYKHFTSKRDLLPILMERLGTHAGPPDFTDHSSRLAARILFLVRLVAAISTLRRNILRACIAARFTNEMIISRSQLNQSREQLQSARDWLLECRDEIKHENPVLAVRVGTYSALQSLQIALLFEALPEELPIDTLINETARLLTSYLTGAEIATV